MVLFVNKSTISEDTNIANVTLEGGSNNTGNLKPKKRIEVVQECLTSGHIISDAGNDLELIEGMLGALHGKANDHFSSLPSHQF